jgi:hypothetical protein
MIRSKLEFLALSWPHLLSQLIQFDIGSFFSASTSALISLLRLLAALVLLPCLGRGPVAFPPCMRQRPFAIEAFLHG